MGRRERWLFLRKWTEVFGVDKNPAERSENKKGFVKIRKGIKACTVYLDNIFHTEGGDWKNRVTNFKMDMNNI